MAGPLVLCVGKAKEAFFQSACAEYCKRLLPFWPVSLHEVAERPPKGGSEAEAKQAMEAEAADLRRLLPQNSFVVALCIEGETPESLQLAETLAKAENSGRRLVFLIGGSNGLDETLKQQADFRLSLSKLTFPHHLARVLLLEQLYRCFTIRTNRKYHK